MSAASFLRRLVGGRGGMDSPLQHLFGLCDALLSVGGEYASMALAEKGAAA